MDVKHRSSPQPKLISSTQKLRMSLKTKRCADPDLKVTFFLVHKLLRRGSTEKELSLWCFFQYCPIDSSKYIVFSSELTGQGHENWCEWCERLKPADVNYINWTLNLFSLWLNCDLSLFITHKIQSELGMTLCSYFVTVHGLWTSYFFMTLYLSKKLQRK